MSQFRNIAPQAAADLNHAVGWLLDHDAAPAAAERLLAAILDAGEKLAACLRLGRRRPELLPDPLRFLSLPRFGPVLIYDSTTIPATILRVLHTAQDLGRLLANLPDVADEGEPSA